MSTDGKDDGSYAPAQRTIAFRDALARCDLEQAKQIRTWADRIMAAVAASPIDAHDLSQLANEMKNISFVVETFSERILAGDGKDGKA